MVLTTEDVEITVGGSPMRMFVAVPRGDNRHPGIICYSDIFQLTGPMRRACVRLAGYGFVVAAPEIYHRLEPPGAAIPFDDDGRSRGMADAAKTTVAEFDADCRATLDYLAAHPRVGAGQLGAMGFCIGGHLAFRAAMQPDVKATTCFYGTGIHNGRLGKDVDAESLLRVNEIRGALLMVFGSRDPHIPEDDREAIDAVLRAARVNYRLRLFDAEHAFMRDEGPRYDPEATDAAFAAMIEAFREEWPRGSRFSGE